MAKTEKQTHKSAEEVKMELVESAEQEKDRECAEEIEAVLKKFNRGLFPYMQRTEGGDFARVRLIRVPAEADVIEADGEDE